MSAVPGSKRHQSCSECPNPTILPSFLFQHVLHFFLTLLSSVRLKDFPLIFFALADHKATEKKNEKEGTGKKGKEKYSKFGVCRRGTLCPPETGSSASEEMNGETEGGQKTERGEMETAQWKP